MNSSSSHIFSSVAILLFTATFASAPSIAHAEDGNTSRFGYHSDAEGSGVREYLWNYQTYQLPGDTQLPPIISPRDDTVRQSNTRKPTSEAEPYVDWAHCAADSQDPDVPDYLRVAVCAYPPPEHGEDTNPQRLPSTREILLSAANLINADGAGLHKRPEGVSYTNRYIPTLVAATHPTQTHTVTLLGHDITITLTATSYTWSWGDGTPDLTTTSPGMPWQEGMDPNTDPALLRHYYKAPNGWKSFLDGPYPSATRTITLTTTWAGTATNPFTGETQTINGLVTTTETTGPFPLGQLIVNNTDTSEEKQGH